MQNQKMVKVYDRPLTFIEIDESKDSAEARRTWLQKHNSMIIRSHFIACPHCGILNEIVYDLGHKMTKRVNHKIIRDLSTESHLTCMHCDKLLIKPVRTKFD